MSTTPQLEALSDESLLQRVGKGDQRAFAELYDRFASRLYGLALRILDQEQDARDALQDGFLYLWDKAADFDPARSRAFTWAAVIFRNKAIDRARARRRRMKLNEDAAEELLPPVSHETADVAVDRAERASFVRGALTGLPVEQRKCIEFAFFKGLTHHQLAELLGEPLGTVKTNIRRGLLRLRDVMKGGGS